MKLMDFASGVLSADPGAAGTVLNSGNFAFLPAVVAPETLRIALDPDGLTGTPEIVVVTAHAAFATSCTATRGAETAYGAGPARAHATDTIWRHTLTVASLIEMMVPAGSVVGTVASTPDIGYVFIDGSTVVNAQVLYPATWARIPASWKSAPDMVMPDWRGRALFSDDVATAFTLGAIGGANTHTLLQAELPAVTVTIDPPALTIDPPNTVISIDPPNTVISIDPPNTAVTGSTGTESNAHIHDTQEFAYGVSPGPGSGSAIGSGGLTKDTGPESVTHTHPAGTLAVDIAAFNANVDIAAFNANVDIAPFNVDPAPFQSGPLGSGTPIDIRPAHGVVNWMLKVH